MTLTSQQLYDTVKWVGKYSDGSPWIVPYKPIPYLEGQLRKAVPSCIDLRFLEDPSKPFIVIVQLKLQPYPSKPDLVIGTQVLVSFDTLSHFDELNFFIAYISVNIATNIKRTLQK